MKSVTVPQFRNQFYPILEISSFEKRYFCFETRNFQI